MELASKELRRRLPALSAAIPISILFITALGIVLTTMVHALELSAAQSPVSSVTRVISSRSCRAWHACLADGTHE